MNTPRKFSGFWLLLPLSLLQGLWLRVTATRLPEATGKRTGTVGHGRRLRLLALGDSIIAGVGAGTIDQSLPVHFARALADLNACSVQWCLQGENGADIAGLRNRIAGLDHGHHADLVLVSIGVNDVIGLSSLKHWRAQVTGLVADLHDRWPQARVLFAGLPPMGEFPLPPQPLRLTLGLRAQALDDIAASIIATRPRMVHIPTTIDSAPDAFCEDGFHPSAEACAVWARELAKRLQPGFWDTALTGA